MTHAMKAGFIDIARQSYARNPVGKPVCLNRLPCTGRKDRLMNGVQVGVQ